MLSKILTCLVSFSMSSGLIPLFNVLRTTTRTNDKRIKIKHWTLKSTDILSIFRENQEVLFVLTQTTKQPVFLRRPRTRERSNERPGLGLLSEWTQPVEQGGVSFSRSSGERRHARSERRSPDTSDREGTEKDFPHLPPSRVSRALHPLRASFARKTRTNSACSAGLANETC